jgi:glycosyltransferase involved in cell wall biosynthesis
MGKNKVKLQKEPFVSICTPTFNRRPFIPMIIKCVEHQTYPRDKIEWLIIDDGTDKIEDLVAHLPYVKYFKYDEKMTIGKKRNLLNEKSRGDIIVYMDDDDYYPPERVKHAVDTLRNSKALCAGSSAMFLYFKHINKMFQFGPYGPNHSTAATFAFKKELLNKTKFDEESSLAEEKKFLKDYTIPFVQLESMKCILVFSHNHNSFDKKNLLNQMPNPHIHETTILPKDIVKEEEILKFFMEDIDKLLDNYELGKIDYKPDVKKQLVTMNLERENKLQEIMKKQNEYNDTLNKINMISNPNLVKKQIDEQSIMIQQLLFENNNLKEQIAYLNNKIKQLISVQIENRVINKSSN